MSLFRDKRRTFWMGRCTLSACAQRAPGLSQHRSTMADGGEETDLCNICQMSDVDLFSADTAQPCNYEQRKTERYGACHVHSALDWRQTVFLPPAFLPSAKGLMAGIRCFGNLRHFQTLDTYLTLFDKMPYDPIRTLGSNQTATYCSHVLVYQFCSYLSQHCRNDQIARIRREFSKVLHIRKLPVHSVQ
jgi:hypothetical protein